jgi:purine-cytosine permease-like protein
MDGDRHMSTTHPDSGARTSGAGIELRSIDHIPDSERHGRVWPMTAVWVAGNANIGTILVGSVGIAAGASLGWTLIAVTLGCAFGTIFAALHSTQGPHLGLPQLIQSRPQFGYRGSVLVIVLALVTYLGAQLFVNLLGAQSLMVTTHLGAAPALAVVALASTLIALFGYNWIHHAARVLAVVFLVVFLVLTVVVLAQGGLTAQDFAPGPLALRPFLLQFGAAAGYQIIWAIYVSDYTRYLPRGVSSSQLFWSTYLGMTLSAAWLAGLGSVLTARFAKPDAISLTQAAGPLVFPGFATIAILAGLLGLIVLGAMNTYGGALTLISAFDCLADIRTSRRLRVVATAIITVVSIGLAVIAGDNLVANFATFLTLLLYLFAPWTAINLTDYFLVRRGRYSIRDIFEPRGIYGSWNSRGLLAYAVGIAVEIPFVHLSWYTGPVAHALGGADLAPFAGLLVGFATYGLLFRREARESRAEQAAPAADPVPVASGAVEEI